MSQKQTISSKQLLAGDLAQLRTLLRFLHTDGVQHSVKTDNDVRENDSSHKLLALLGKLRQSELDCQQSLEEAIKWVESDQRSALDDAELSWICFLDDMYKHWLDHVDLDVRLQNILLGLRLEFVMLVIGDESLICSPGHPFCVLLEQMMEVGKSWYGDLGKSGEQFLTQMIQIIGDIKSHESLDSKFLQETLTRWQDYVDKEEQKVSRLEKRLYDSEAGLIRARRAHHIVIEAINSTLAGKQVPAVFSEFCLGPWQDEMRLYLIQNGVENEAWLRGQKLLETLARSFRIARSDEERQRLYSVVPKLGSEFEQHIADISSQPEKYQPVVSAIEAAHIQVLKGEAVECVTVKPLETPDGIAGVATSVSGELKKKAQEIGEGQWLSYQLESGKKIRCKLLVKILETDQSLFVNRNGLKVLQKSIDELAYCLSVKIVKILPGALSIMQAYQQSVRSVLADYESRQQEIRQALTIKAEEERKIAEQKEEELKAQQAEKIARELAAAKAKREAEAIKQAREMAEREEKKRQEQEQNEILQQEKNAREKETDQLRRMARLSLDSMSLGSWVEILGAEDEKKTCKLAVKVNSTRKFIFVDSNGQKVAELYRDDLVEMILAKKAKILEQSDHFEDRLAKVVSSLRRDKSS